MDTDRLIRLTKYATLGSDPPDLQEDERERFEQLKAEVEQMRATGQMIDLPSEFPDL